MAADQKWIAMLSSAEPNVRYEACELMRIAPALSPQARLALEGALHDPDREVAERAEAALRVHRTVAEPLQAKGAASQLSRDGSGPAIASLSLGVFAAVTSPLPFLAVSYIRYLTSGSWVVANRIWDPYFEAYMYTVCGYGGAPIVGGAIAVLGMIAGIISLRNRRVKRRVAILGIVLSVLGLLGHSFMFVAQ